MVSSNVTPGIGAPRASLGVTGTPLSVVSNAQFSTLHAQKGINNKKYITVEKLFQDCQSMH